VLGIRRYQGTAIDLWQGDLKKFSCDAAVVFFSAGTQMPGFPPVSGLPAGEAISLPARESGYPSSQLLAVSYLPVANMEDRGKLGTVLGSYANALAFAASLGVRHVAMSVPQSEELGDLYGSLAMVALKSFLDESAVRHTPGVNSKGGFPAPPRRITLVMGSLPVYDCFQAQLFAAFADLP
jgi:hypothetical protein